MKVRRFTHNDLSSVNNWLRKHDSIQVTMNDLPRLGFIVPGVCAGFLRECEGQLSIFDSLVSNPHASRATRNKALDALFDTIKMFGGRQILGFTLDVGTLARAESHGFRQLPHTGMIFVKE